MAFLPPKLFKVFLLDSFHSNNPFGSMRHGDPTTTAIYASPAAKRKGSDQYLFTPGLDASRGLSSSSRSSSYDSHKTSANQRIGSSSSTRPKDRENYREQYDAPPSLIQRSFSSSTMSKEREYYIEHCDAPSLIRRRSSSSSGSSRAQPCATSHSYHSAPPAGMSRTYSSLTTSSSAFSRDTAKRTETNSASHRRTSSHLYDAPRISRQSSHLALKKTTSTRISSGNRFYADVIARQVKDLKKRKTRDSLPENRRVSVTRAPATSGFMRVPSTSMITRTASSEFASSFFHLNLSRTPSSAELVT